MATIHEIGAAVAMMLAGDSDEATIARAVPVVRDALAELAALREQHTRLVAAAQRVRDVWYTVGAPPALDEAIAEMGALVTEL